MKNILFVLVVLSALCVPALADGMDAQIGTLFGSAFGSPLAVALIGFVLFIVFIVAIRISFEGAFALLMGFVHLLAFGGGLPQMFFWILLLIDGIIIAFAFLKMIGRH